MFKDITIGQYYPGNSIIHKLDPRVKLVETLIFIVSVFFMSSVWSYGLVTVYLLMIILLSRVPVRHVLRTLKPVLFIIILTFILNVFLTSGETVLAKWWIFTIRKESLIFAAKMAVRLIYLVLGSSIMALTTTPNDMADGMEKGLRPLNKIHIPVHEMAMMITIALRFIPILMEEGDKIRMAQISRGADFEGGNIFKKAKNMVPLLVPLFVSAFRRAGDLSLAMDARCYHGGDGRTKYKPLKYKKRDAVAYLVTLLYLGGIITIFILL